MFDTLLRFLSGLATLIVAITRLLDIYDIISNHLPWDNMNLDLLVLLVGLLITYLTWFAFRPRNIQ